MKRLAFVLLFLACAKSGRAPQLIAQYGCNACHVIPGVPGHASIGPSLAGIASRPMISNGRVKNTPENLAKFIQNPASLNPATSMPGLDMPPADAQEIANYLGTLK